MGAPCERYEDVVDGIVFINLAAPQAPETPAPEEPQAPEGGWPEEPQAPEETQAPEGACGHKKPKKLAFCFLIYDTINHAGVWRAFFDGVDEARYSVYVHCKVDARLDPFFERRKLPLDVRVATAWGDVSIVRAQNALLRAALDDAANTSFLFLSDACIPLKRFDHVYAAVGAASHFNVCPQAQCFPRCDAALALLPREHVQKAHQWCILNAAHARLVADPAVEREYLAWFEGVSAPDEHCYITLLTHRGLRHELVETPNLADGATTFTNWGAPYKFAGSAHAGRLMSYRSVAPDELAYLVQSASLFGREFAAECAPSLTDAAYIAAVARPVDKDNQAGALITDACKGRSSDRIYCFWTGSNEMSHNRRVCLEQLGRVSECDIILVTAANLHHYILPGHPIHPAYELLSETHRADYLRTYFMHFHGGAYSDIKKTTGSWKRAFSDLRGDANYWICGYPEVNGGVAWRGGDWTVLIGNGAYISKPNTPLTTEWYDEMVALLDSKLPELRLHPAGHPRDCSERSRYPIGWNEMLGRIFHKVATKYKSHLLRSLPVSVFSDYM
jgi:hypothetical protein